MSILISNQFDCTQKEFVLKLARIIYAGQGCDLPEDPDYLWESSHPAEIGVLAVAESIAELVVGHELDYSDEED